MEFSLLDSNYYEDVIELFTSAFSDSEGKDEGNIIGKLVSELITTTSIQDLFGFVAFSHGKIIGCIFFSRLTVPNEVKAFILSPVAVATANQRKGIGQKLISFGLEHLKGIDVDLVFTYGDPKFYSKTGFKHISEEYVKAPLKLTYPEGWLGQSLSSIPIEAGSGTTYCVEALSKQEYW